jgi:hypothetical protein
MARMTLSQVRSLGNFTTSENWYIQFTTLPSGVSFTSEDLNLRCETFSKPSRSNEVNKIQLRGLPPVNQHGITTPNQTTEVVLFSTVDMKVETMIKELMATAGVNGIKESSPGRYKKDSELVMRAVLKDVTDKEIYAYEFTGVLIESYESGGELGPTSELIKPSISFVWDDFTETKL